MKLLVVDGNSLINRAFYGIKLLTAKDGHYTNAIYGFFNMLFSLCDTVQPDGVAVAFDLKAPTFRHAMYDAYKAGRKGMPPELFEQMEPVKELLRAFGYHILTAEGYEADDILGTLSAACDNDTHCYIATGDRDALQLVKENVTVLLTATKAGGTVLTHYSPEKITEEYGVAPEQLIDIKALQGDSSDNIPGVAGIGPKTAGDLIKACGSLEEVYKNIDTLHITETLRNKLKDGRESAFLSRRLGEICLTVPLPSTPALYRSGEQNRPLLLKLFAGHEMLRFIKRLGLDELSESVQDNSEAAPAEKPLVLLPCTQLQARIAAEKRAYFLTEPTGDDIGAVLFCFDDLVAMPDTGSFDSLLFFRKLLEDETIEKHTCDAKRLFAWALAYGFEVGNVVMDTALAGYLLNPNAADYSVATMSIGMRIPRGAPQPDKETVGFAAAYQTLCQEAFSFRLLCTRLTAQLVENEQQTLLTEMEIPLAKVLAAMERTGIRVDTVGIESFGEKLAMDINRLEREIYEAAGCSFNINSPKQLGEVLFEKLQLPHGKKTKTGYSTNAEILEGLGDEYPIVGKILQYRTYMKLRSTYCEGLLKVVGNDGRIRSTFNQTETRTGRLSSSEPNLQNIPVRTELGREMRRFFLAKEGCLLVDADYSQIELRVLAAAAADNNMIEAFNAGTDIHTVTASQVFGMPPDMITPLMRARAKAVNFGIVYGIGAFSLAKDIGVSRAEADRYIKNYLAHYDGVQRYMENCIALAKERGYAETLLHRRRYLPELKSSNAALRAFGERVARNMPIQGTAADIIKIAMVRVYDRLRRELPDAALLMQVHDELILEVPEEQAQTAAALLCEEMENALPLQVKLSADVHIGKTWYDAKG